ncbi:hypothetical protein CDIK_4023 [Cucumispora dikerogammari]|nr:hypothetical protein CDIK_4023 [Cucumispora dikerogammari]
MLQNTITTLVAQDSALNQRGISESLGLIGTTLSQSAVSRKLKDYQLTRKKLTLVPAERNSPRIIEVRFNYAREISLYQTSQLVFLDETGFNLHTSSNYGYSFVNTKAFRTVPANRGINISLMCSISTNEVVGYKIQDGAYSGNLFISYLNETIVLYFRKHSDAVLVMNDCRFHYRQDVKQFLIEKTLTSSFYLSIPQN